MNSTQFLWTLVATQLILIGFAWTAALPISRDYRPGIVGLVAFNLVLGASLMLIALRSQLPYFVTHSLANFLILWAVVAVVQGGAQLLKFQNSQFEMWVVLTVAGLGILGFGISEATSDLRSLSLMLAVTWLLGRAGFKVLNLAPERHLRGPVKSIGLVSLLIAALLFLRALAGAATRESIEFSVSDGATLAWPYVVLVGASLANLGFAYLTISTVVVTLRNRSRADELTGLLNRKSIMDEIHKAWRRFSQMRQPFAVIALDIDNLRSVNVAHGYPMGDAVLAEIAKALGAVLRPGDVLGRAGGGKMIAILPGASLILARVTAERMRGQVADMQHLFADQRVQVSASLGVVLSELSDLSEEGVLARANTQLNRAKAAGRDRVEIDNRESTGLTPLAF